jgi:hypothetical protein
VDEVENDRRQKCGDEQRRNKAHFGGDSRGSTRGMMREQDAFIQVHATPTYTVLIHFMTDLYKVKEKSRK